MSFVSATWTMRRSSRSNATPTSPLALEHRRALEKNKAYQQSTCVIWPTSKQAQGWDLVLAVVLVYTVIVTPFQVAFLLTTPLPIFILNRGVDCVLLTDMVLQMFLVYQTSETSSRSSGKWVTNITKIRLNYLKKWFTLDFIGLLSSLAEVADIAGGGAITRTTRFVQAVRFFRLFRLARVFDRVRTATIRMAASMPTQIGFFGGEFLAWIMKLLLIAHVVACVMGFMATTEGLNGQGSSDWLKAVLDNKNLSLDRSQPMQMYVLSLYWSCTTLITIGYGDITPQTLEEHMVCIVVMVLGGISWTLLMATAVSLANAMDQERLQHGVRVETLIRMCSDHGLPKDLTNRLLHFLVKSRRMELLAQQQHLMSKMSPSLQSEVAVHLTERLLRKVDIFERSESGFTVALASSLRLQIFPPKEWIVPKEQAFFVESVTFCAGDLNTAKSMTSERPKRAMTPGQDPATVTRGFLNKHQAPHLTMLEGGIVILTRILCSGSCWHQDLILSEESLREREVAQSVVFCSVYMLSRDVLFSTLQDTRFPKAKQLVKYGAVKLALHRLVTQAAPRAAENGYSLVKACDRILGQGSSPAKDCLPDFVSEASGCATQPSSAEFRGLSDRLGAVERQLGKLVELLEARSLPEMTL